MPSTIKTFDSLLSDDQQLKGRSLSDPQNSDPPIHKNHEFSAANNTTTITSTTETTSNSNAKPIFQISSLESSMNDSMHQNTSSQNNVISSTLSEKFEKFKRLVSSYWNLFNSQGGGGGNVIARAHDLGGVGWRIVGSSQGFRAWGLFEKLRSDPQKILSFPLELELLKLRIEDNSICQYMEAYLYVMDLMENNFSIQMYEQENFIGFGIT